MQTTLTLRTRRGLNDITEAVRAVVGPGALCNVFVHHTSCSLVIQENADPDVQRDLEAFMQRLVPDGDPLFRHTAEGPDDMPAHVRTALTAVSLTVPVVDSRLALGTWQGLYLWEHRRRPRQRMLIVTVF